MISVSSSSEVASNPLHNSFTDLGTSELREYGTNVSAVSALAFEAASNNEHDKKINRFKNILPMEPKRLREALSRQRETGNKLRANTAAPSDGNPQLLTNSLGVRYPALSCFD